jgi:hypothetical protein
MSITSLSTIPSMRLNFNFHDLTLTRFEYKSPPVDMNSTVHDYCAVRPVAWIFPMAQEEVDWADIKTSCSRRHWAYAVIVLVPLFVGAVGIAIVVW